MLLVLLLFARQALAYPVVNVGAYNFPPYIEKAESAHPDGLLVDLLALLNTQQKEFNFVLVPTSVTRRYQDLASGRFDLIFFESPQWGWQGMAPEHLDLQVEDAEVYVAKVLPGRDQHYFDSLTGKRLALYTGYHYGFAGFNADRDFLRQHYQAEFSYSHDSNLLKVLHQRADLTVIMKSYLQRFMQQNPGSAEQLLVSVKTDQVYQHQVLLRPGSPISAERLGQLLQQLRDSGQLQVLLQRYKLSGTQGH
ncbi:transporter substrate-binding domain-containing protein [Pseudomonas sp. N040]|nr:transporter substrate-binding domain-containing protein [Pseudomonas sp. N040]